MRVSLLTAALLLCIGPAAAESIRGKVARVHDGDTLVLETGVKVRLFGIDAPELKQMCRHGNRCVPCGQAARDSVLALTRRDPVVCETRGKSYDRVVAACRTGAADLGLALVQRGAALADPQYLPKRDPLRTRYLEAEADARRRKVGVWESTFVPPSDWRRHKARLTCERDASK
jgi:endonuclease YncB( thermonuclease family)